MTGTDQTANRALRVQFIHGLEGSPQGAKAQLLAQHFTAVTPVMDTSDFEGCVALHAETIASFRPDILVGSSFGGAVAVALLQRRLWRGPTLLLAQAAQHFGLAAALPEGVDVWLIHGRGDDVVDIEGSRALARSGTAELVRLIEVDDDHSLHATVESGRLIQVIRELSETAHAASRR
jgi:alpha/beta superfamily hydrolase